MARIAAFIDGFNLFHALDSNPDFHKYKWLNLAKLIRCFAYPQDETKAIYYFTAYATWSPDKVKRHTAYVRALELESVKPVLVNLGEETNFVLNATRDMQLLKKNKRM